MSIAHNRDVWYPRGTQTPIIIQDTRRCIVVDGRTYCEEKPFNKKEFGIVLSVTIVAVFLIIASIYVWDQERNPLLAVAIIGIPLLGLLIWCLT